MGLVGRVDSERVAGRQHRSKGRNEQQATTAANAAHPDTPSFSGPAATLH
jgi:hypothetical protein